MSSSVSGTAKKGNALRLVPVGIFLAVAGLFAVALQSGDPSKLPSTLIGKPVPASDFPAIDGLTAAGGAPVPGFSSADLANGKVTVVNFWASWCTSCIEEHPLLAEIKAASGVEIYGVAQKDDPAASRRFLGRYGNPFSAAGQDRTGRTSIDWGVYGMPETFIVNGKGEIAYKHVGPISKETMASKVLPAIAAAKSGKPAATK